MDVTGPDRGAILRGVVAYVEVWSSNRTENYSKTFAQQLLDLGAKVSKFFNKEVTHVVFKDGHQGTWKKATKTGVKLVSVLWVEKCIEAGLHIDESSFPAINTNDGLPQLIKKKRKCMQPKDFIEKTPETDRRLQRKFDKMAKELDVQKATAGFDVPVLLFDEDGELMYSPKTTVVHRGNAMEKRIQEMKYRREHLSPTASQMSQPSIQSSGPAFIPSLGDTPSASADHSFPDVISETLNSSFEDLFGKPRNIKMKAVVLYKDDNCASALKLNREHTSPPLPSPDPFQLTPVKDKRTLPLGRPSLVGEGNEPSVLEKKRLFESSASNAVPTEGMSSSPVVLKSDNTICDTPSHVNTTEKNRISSAFKSACEVFSEHFTNEESRDCLTSNGFGKKPVRNVKSTSSLKSTALTSAQSNMKKCILPELLTPPPMTSKSSDTKNKKFSYEDFFSAPKQKKNKSILNRFSLGALSRKSPSPPPVVARKQQALTKRRRSTEESDDVISNQSKKRSRTFQIRVVPHSKLKIPTLKGQSKSTSPLNGLPKSKRHDKPSAVSYMTNDSKSSTKTSQRTEVVCTLVQPSSSKVPNMNTRSTQAHSFSKTLESTVFTPPPVKEKNKQANMVKEISVGSIASLQSSDYTHDGTEPSSIEIPASTLTLIHCTKPGMSTGEKKEFPIKKLSLSLPSEKSDWNTINGFCDVVSDQKSKSGAPSMKKERTKKPKRSLVMTSMPTEKQQTVIQVVDTFGGFFFSDNVCETTTHVVAGNPRRTMNIMLGIARGCWIVSFEWVLWSLENGRWIPEEPYELSSHFPAAPICRLQRQLSTDEYQLGLFSGQPVMFISATSQPPGDNLIELMQLCGGKVSKTLRQAAICVGPYNGKKSADLICVSEKWILDSITQHRVCSLESYYL
ncbi:microcephalin isoform X2 [Pleurodeles waltl]|uniref:microcephalin isoform X2 n=1 Tax=Pleurodeles waltl TaxID=8319 RepID=UPI003709BA3D